MTHRSNAMPPSQFADGNVPNFSDPVETWIRRHKYCYGLAVIVFCAGWVASVHLPYYLEPTWMNGDMRMHFAWLHRLSDPSLFPNDIIMDYFQAFALPPIPKSLSIGAVHFSNLWLGPHLIGTFLSVAFLGASYVMGYSVTQKRHTGGLLVLACIAGFELLRLNAWSVAGPIIPYARAYVPLIGALAVAFFQSCPIGSGCCLVMAALCYPPLFVVLSIAIVLRFLWNWFDGKLLRAEIQLHRAELVGGLIAFGCVSVSLLSSETRFGSVYSLSELKRLPEIYGALALPGFPLRADIFPGFLTGGGIISSFFYDQFHMQKLTILAVIILVLFFVLKAEPSIRVLAITGLQLFLAGFIACIVAYVLALHLYEPSRMNSVVSSPIQILAFVCVAIWIDRKMARLTFSERLRAVFLGRHFSSLKKLVYFGSVLIVLFVSAILSGKLYSRSYSDRPVPQLPPKILTALQNLPKDAVVAGLPNLVEEIPLICKRSILLSELALLPYHNSFYPQMRTRLTTTLNALFSPSWEEARTALRRAGATHLIVDERLYKEAQTDPPSSRVETVYGLLFYEARLKLLNTGKQAGVMFAPPQAVIEKDGPLRLLAMTSNVARFSENRMSIH